MQVIRRPAELAQVLATMRPCALVPTMGALHEGHLALLAAAADHGPVVASIFVNPLQFGPAEDFARYPRAETQDLDALGRGGCTIAFLPAIADMYPPGSATTIEVAGPALRWEGERRPGHFRGVATVVARLLGLARPASAWFGEKDWQQLQVIRRMVGDLALPVTIMGVPTQRATDGLALSSRNRFLNETDRRTAPALASICTATAAELRAGAPVAAALARATAALESGGFVVDYVAAVDPQSMEPLAALAGPARLIAAAALGGVRLLDNVAI